jgi:hypothetical protein
VAAIVSMLKKVSQHLEFVVRPAELLGVIASSRWPDHSTTAANNGGLNMPEFFFDDAATRELRSDVMLSLESLDFGLAEAFEPLLLLLVESINMRPPAMRAAAVTAAKEKLAEISLAD